MTRAIIDIGDAPNDGTGDPVRDAFNKCNNNFSELYAADAVSATTPVPPQGRLTLQTITPVMTTTQAAKTTIFYTPYVGNQVPIYDGSNMTMTTFAEVSVGTTDATKSPAAIGASKVNDWFVWSDAGTIRIGHGPDWTSDTARSAGTALVMVNGILLNNASISNGPAASRGTYVGTTRSNASSQLDWIYGTVAAGGGTAKFMLWNCYNRVSVRTIVSDNTDSWSYSTAAWRAVNGNVNNSVQFVSGLQEDAFSAAYYAQVNQAGVALGIGLNQTTAYSGIAALANVASSFYSNLCPNYDATVLGANTFYAIENAYSAGAYVGYGDAGVATTQTGLHFDGRL